MNRAHEPYDLRVTNDRMAAKRKRLADFRERTQRRRRERDKRRLLELLMQRGVVR